MSKIFVLIGTGVIVTVGLYSLLSRPHQTEEVSDAKVGSFQQVPATPSVPASITLTGTYVCLPPKSDVTTADCAFGILTNAGEYYAVNFGAGAGSMADFKDGATVTATGTLIPRADLKPDSWTKFEMSGLFTVLEKVN